MGRGQLDPHHAEALLLSFGIVSLHILRACRVDVRLGVAAGLQRQRLIQRLEGVKDPEPCHTNQQQLRALWILKQNPVADLNPPPLLVVEPQLDAFPPVPDQPERHRIQAHAMDRYDHITRSNWIRTVPL